MLTIGRVAFTVYERWHPMCPVHLQRWQVRAISAWQDRADAHDEEQRAERG